MDKVKSFRDLKVWQQAMDLVSKAYELVKTLPREETYALGDQIRRSAVSIPANIAEGHARQHTKEFLQHLSIARGSLAELETLLLICERIGYTNRQELESFQEMVADVRMPLYGLVRSLQNKL